MNTKKPNFNCNSTLIAMIMVAASILMSSLQAQSESEYESDSLHLEEWGCQEGLSIESQDGSLAAPQPIVIKYGNPKIIAPTNVRQGEKGTFRVEMQVKVENNTGSTMGFNIIRESKLTKIKLKTESKTFALEPGKKKSIKVVVQRKVTYKNNSGKMRFFVRIKAGEAKNAIINHDFVVEPNSLVHELVFGALADQAEKAASRANSNFEVIRKAAKDARKKNKEAASTLTVAQREKFDTEDFRKDAQRPLGQSRSLAATIVRLVANFPKCKKHGDFARQLNRKVTDADGAMVQNNSRAQRALGDVRKSASRMKSASAEIESSARRAEKLNRECRLASDKTAQLEEEEETRRAKRSLAEAQRLVREIGKLLRSVESAEEDLNDNEKVVKTQSAVITKSLSNSKKRSGDVDSALKAIRAELKKAKKCVDNAFAPLNTDSIEQIWEADGSNQSAVDDTFLDEDPEAAGLSFRVSLTTEGDGIVLVNNRKSGIVLVPSSRPQLRCKATPLPGSEFRKWVFVAPSGLEATISGQESFRHSVQTGGTLKAIFTESE